MQPIYILHYTKNALTDARRYALFTLVGIADEDDLDAPDLISQRTPASKPDGPPGNQNGQRSSGQAQSTQQFSSLQSTKAASNLPKSALDPKGSAALRDQLTAEIEEIKSDEEAANWAHRVLSAKNTLTTADAERVEQAFQARLAWSGSWCTHWRVCCGGYDEQRPSRPAFSKFKQTISGTLKKRTKFALPRVMSFIRFSMQTRIGKPCRTVSRTQPRRTRLH